ncbi:hypothetical protein QQZ08_009326 [Neonectria magnoliae]|uniref:DRBM domain-containing protein n=1 Tax=Neonectria magnoliae TaxID=2732573 RepID=A0ABR1HNX3_9HYPO
MAPQNGESSTGPIDLQILQAKLTAWKKWETDNGRPMAFSRTEENALRLLTRTDTEPEIDDDNYIGKLLGRLSMPPGMPVEEHLIDHVTGYSRFRAYYTLPDGRGKFPRKGFGYEAGETAPSFSQKKASKQFAAKWALSGLRGLHPSNVTDDDDDDDDADDDYVDASDSAPDIDSDSEGSSHYYEVGGGDSDDNENHDCDDSEDDKIDSHRRVNHPPPSVQHSPERKKLKIADPEVQNGAPITPPLGLKQKYTSLPSDMSLFKRVEVLCKKLGIDIPRYHVKGETNGLWSGRPRCWVDGLMPENLGHVRDVQSESEAKALMAEEVLVWLKGEERKRESQHALGKKFGKLRT